MSDATRMLDLAKFVRSGDCVVLGQGPGEPTELLDLLLRERRRIGRFTLFCGVTFTDRLRAEHLENVALLTYGAVGPGLRSMVAGGAIDMIPCHASDIPRLFRDGIVRPDVVMTTVSPADDNGSHSLGVAVDYLADAIPLARTVIAEVNDQMPFTCGPVTVPEARLDGAVEVSRPLPVFAPPEPTAEDRRAAEAAAELIPDGCTVQMGVGAIPRVVLRLLRSRTGIRVHSGMVTDEVLDLVEAEPRLHDPAGGARVVAAGAWGSREFYSSLHHNAQFEFRPISHTHDIRVLGSIPRFVAINGALEVDLSGQVNAEVADGRYVGAVGGQIDFLRGAALSPGGFSIIAMPSITKDGTRSRIVPHLTQAVVTTPRSDVDYVVTEFGAVRLFGKSLPERARALTAIAHPRFRDALDRQVRLEAKR